MASQNKVKFSVLKSFLFLIVVAAILVISPASMAAGGGGPTPDQAVILAEDVVYTAPLNPLEQHWFKFMPDTEGQPRDVENSLTLTFTPDENNITEFVSLKVFEEDQLSFFSEDDASQMTPIGVGQAIEQDDNPETTEIFWTGWLSSQKTYYVQVLNGSDFSIDYRLSSTGIGAPPPLSDEPEAAEETEIPAEGAELPTVDSNLGDTPNNPIPLPPGTVKSTLPPKTTKWYSLHYPDFTNDKQIEKLDFSLFFTPDDGHRSHKVNFELYDAKELKLWWRGEADKMTNFGAGMLVSRDGDYNTGERIWRGAVLNNNDYLLVIKNGTDIEIDYWLFDDDVYNPLLGDIPAPSPSHMFASGAAPQTALPLKLGVNKGGLAPGEEAWHSFIIDLDGQKFTEMALTMITTPDDGNRIRYMTFDVFTVGGVQYWSPGDNTKINNVGAGGVVYRDDNPLTGERFWKGWVVDNELYLVQIRNGTEVYMDYHLFTGDVYKPELGEKTVPEPRVFASGTAPSVPEPLAVGVNDGSLQPGEEQWYVFSRGDVDQIGRVEAIFTMVFTPDDGNRVRKVNFELFESDQLRDWAPDNPNNLHNFGQGSVVSRDNGLETGELLWKGHVMAGDLYYMRVSNGSDVTIDYRIFPEDVIYTSLVSQ